MTKTTLMMCGVGFLSIYHSYEHYNETTHLDLMSVVMLIMTVLYFVLLTINKLKEDRV